MVDRIVPAATAQHRATPPALGLDDACALATEGFWEWVIERRFVDPADAAVLRAAGRATWSTTSSRSKRPSCACSTAATPPWP
jgi:hypothetical protein